jgi:WD40 repeat protein
MPKLTVRCPKCDTKLRVEVDDADDTVECPECVKEFVATARRPRRAPAPAKSNAPLVVGIAVGAVVVLVAVVGLVVALSGEKQPVAQNPPPAVLPADPAPPAPRPQVPLPKPKDPLPKPPADPGPRPGAPEDAFARAATFRADGPLPELPPLPPVERRPLLVLDPGGHTAFPKQVFFTPDATRVLSVADDKTVRAWDVASGEPVFTVRLPAGPGLEGNLDAAALSPDGTRLAVGGFPFAAGKSGIPFYVLDARTGELLETVPGCLESVRALDFSPDGKLIAVGCANGAVQVYEFASKKWVFRGPAAHADRLRQVRFHPKNALTLATLGGDNTVKIWDLTKANPVAAIALGERKPNSIDWKPDGSELAIGGVSGEVLTHDAAGKPLRRMPPLMENGKDPIQIVRLRYLPDGSGVVFGGVSGAGWAGVRCGDEPPVLMRDHSNTVMAADCSADGALAVTAGGEANEVIVWKTADGKPVRRFQAASKSVWAVGWSKDGKALAWGNTNRHDGTGLCAVEQTFRLTDFQPGAAPKAGEFLQHQRTDGAYSIRVDDFFTFTVMENGRPLYQHRSRSDRIYSVSFLPGTGIVVGASHAIYAIDTQTGKVIRDYVGDRGLTTAVSPSPDGRYFATASTDQVIRVWQPGAPDPLLSIFAVGREWIAWTPQGYYACSAFGERLVGWQVNNGIAKAPAVHPAERFRPSLYQPALLKYLLPAGDTRLALAMARTFERQQIAATGLAEVLPPAVSVTAPEVAGDAPIEVRATAEGTDRNPIVAMRLLIDGRPFPGAGGVKRFDRLAKAEASWKLTVPPGAHTFAVLAESPVSKGLSRWATVTRAGATEKPNLYVLAVGVSAYPGPLKLNYAASDAVLTSNALRAKGGALFANIETKLVTDADATKSNVLAGLDWLHSKMTPKDVGVVFFSGHGGRDDDTGKFFLVPVDIGPDLSATGVSGDDLKARLERMPGRLVAILDACHSGAVADAPPARADGLVRDLLTAECGVVVLASSLGSEVSLESPLTKAGFFTLGLTEGLAGRADLNGDGVVYLNELSLYASVRVQQLSNGTQNPTVGRPPNIMPFPIAKP